MNDPIRETTKEEALIATIEKRDLPSSEAMRQHASHKAALARMDGPIDVRLRAEIAHLKEANTALEARVSAARIENHAMQAQLWDVKHLLAETRSALAKYEGLPATKRAVRLIQDVVTRAFNVTLVNLNSAKRSNDIVLPRQIAIWLSRNLTSFSFPEIGRQFGHRDHSTIIHAIRKIDTMIAADAAFAERIAGLRAELSGISPTGAGRE